MHCCPGRCRCDPARLLPRICELADHVEIQRVELLQLRDRLHGLPSPQLAALASEGGTLEQRTRQGAATLSALRTDIASFEWSLEKGNAEARQLEKERRSLLQRLGELEASEKKLKQTAEEAEEQLTSERHLAEERALGHESALNVVAHRALQTEQRSQGAERLLRRLRGAAAEAEAMAMSMQRASAAEEERTKKILKDLQARLQRQREQEKKVRREQEKREKEMNEMNEEEMKEVETEMQIHMDELQSELQQCEKMRRAEKTLAAQLHESRRKGAEIETKAMNVARELVDSSQAIAWLQSEVAAKRDGRAELEEMHQRNVSLRQQLAIPAAPVEKATEEMDHEDREDRRKATLVSEALQVAWEGEAREHRQAQQRLHALQTSCLTPARQELLRLAELLLHNSRSDVSRGINQSAVEDLVRRLREGKLSMDAVHQLMTYMEIFAMEQVEAWQGRESRTRHRSQAAEKEKPEKLRMSRSTPSRKPWDSDASPSERLEPIARRQAVHSLHPVPVPVVPGTTGPLYRLQHQHPASPARGRPRRLERRFDRDLELEERFDEYSVHRPRRKAT